MKNNANTKLIISAVVTVLLIIAASIFVRNHIGENEASNSEPAVLPGAQVINEGQVQTQPSEALPSTPLIATPTSEPTGDRYTFKPEEVKSYDGDKSSLPGDTKVPLGVAQLEGQGMVGNNHDKYSGANKELFEAIQRVSAVTDNRYGPAYDSPENAYKSLLDGGYITQDFYDSSIKVYSPYGGAVKENNLTLQQVSLSCAIVLENQSLADQDSGTVTCKNQRVYVDTNGMPLSSSEFEKMTGTESIIKDNAYNVVTVQFIKQDGSFKIKSLTNSDDN